MAKFSPEQKFARLQAEWYRKAARPYKDKDGNKMQHVDIERFIDYNRIPATTLPRAHGSFLFEPDSDELEQDGAMPLADTDIAAYWREVSRKVQSLPRNWKGRELLVTFADSGSLHIARLAHGLSRRKARTIVTQFLEWAGLPTSRSRTPRDQKPEPAPVRKLTAQEIAGLNLTPPKHIKDATEV